MSSSLAAFLSGCIFMSIFCGWCMLLYNKILVRKAEKKTAECIRGKFYYIVPEEEYIKSHNGEEKK